MLVVKIEIWPFGNMAEKREIGRTYIWNKGDRLPNNHGNYGVAICSEGDFELARGEHPITKAEYGANVSNHNRASNVWLLVRKAIEAAIP